MKDTRRIRAMRALNRIVDSVRRNESATEDELRMAICAQDILIAKAVAALKEHGHTELIAEYFKASAVSADLYVGWENSPENPDFVKWHRAKALESAQVKAR